MRARFTIGVFGIITDAANKVLLCRRTDVDFWNLPGGGLEAGETPWAGVVREVFEETGLRVTVTKLAGIYSKSPNNEIVFVFGCRPKSGSLHTNLEARSL
jgi:8-oxo-dGTP diphosphatase